jgi:hypothetical protein
MAAKPAFAATPRHSSAAASVADTSLTAPTNAAVIFAAGASGSRVERLRLTAAGTTLVGLVNVFVHDGTSFRLIRSVAVSAITPSATVQAWGSDENSMISFAGGLMLPSGWSLRITTTVANTIVGAAEGGDF